MKNIKIGAARIVILAIVMISFVSCNSSPESTPTYPPIRIYPTKDYSPGLREVRQNQTKWESQHITHYRMSIIDDRGGHMFMPAVVEVKDGNVISLVDSRGEEIFLNHDTSMVDGYEYVFTITGLFIYISQTYSQQPPSMRVTYHSTLGYPEIIYIDPFSEPCCQDFTIEVRDFQALQ